MTSSSNPSARATHAPFGFSSFPRCRHVDHPKRTLITFLEQSITMRRVSTNQRIQIIGHLQAGYSISHVSRLFNMRIGSVYDLRRCYQGTGSTRDTPRIGHPRRTSPTLRMESFAWRIYAIGFKLPRVVQTHSLDLEVVIAAVGRHTQYWDCYFHIRTSCEHMRYDAASRGSGHNQMDLSFSIYPSQRFAPHVCPMMSQK